MKLCTEYKYMYSLSALTAPTHHVDVPTTCNPSADHVTRTRNGFVHSSCHTASRLASLQPAPDAPPWSRCARHSTHTCSCACAALTTAHQAKAVPHVSAHSRAASIHRPSLSCEHASSYPWGRCIYEYRCIQVYSLRWCFAIQIQCIQLLPRVLGD